MDQDYIGTTKCVICGKDIPMDMTQIMIILGSGKYVSSCCSHEGSKEMIEYMKEHKDEIQANSKRL